MEVQDSETGEIMEPAAVAAPESAVEESVETVKQENADEGKKEDAESQKEDDAPLPKKAINALKYRDKKIVKLHSERTQLLAEIEALRAAQSSAKTSMHDGGPREEDFETYEDFLEAKIMHKLEGKMGKSVQQEKESGQEAEQKRQHEAYVAERTQNIVAKVEDREKATPGYKKAYEDVVRENAEFFDYISPEIERVFLEADDPGFAFFNLAKSGKLAEVIQMNPIHAAMEIAKAQMQPFVSSMPAQKPPAPLTGARGTGKTQKSLIDFEGEALLKRISDYANS